ncbi:MAG: HAD family hydrolase [Promethearchaeota archaeon]
MNNSIRNIIFDIGNVLLYWQPAQFLTQFTDDQNRINKFVSNVIKNSLWSNLDRGTISLEYARNEYLAKYPEESELLTSFFSHWMEMLTPIRENIEILYELKSNKYSLYLLSNFIKEALDFMQDRFNFFTIFDGKAISCQIKYIKPELQIYKYLITKYNLDPEECVYIDDISPYLTQASNLKMRTIHYLPHVDLREELRKLGVKI